MSAKESVLIGSAGEHFVLYRLHREGILAAQSPAGARDADILVFDENGLGRRVQVKTRTSGRDGGWHMKAKHDDIRDPGLVYAFVDLEPDPPVVYIVPSAVVADLLTHDHSGWLERPGRGGRAHQDTVMRRLRPVFDYPAQGFEGRWLERYRDRWDLLRASPEASEAPANA